AVAIRLLKDYAGTVIVDGYRPYEVAQLANPNILLAHCWSHARREVLPFEADPRGARVLRVIQRMYRLEAIAAERQLSPEKLLEWRQRSTQSPNPVVRDARFGATPRGWKKHEWRRSSAEYNRSVRQVERPD